MISARINLDCDVLSVGHHGSSGSTTWDFLESTTPSYAVISCGTGNQYNHPSAETMGRLSDMGIPIFRTDKQGTVLAVSDGTVINWSQEPCNDYSSGENIVREEIVASVPQPAQKKSSSVVWLPATVEKYHSIPDCGKMNPARAKKISRSDAEAMGYTPCKKCF